MTKGLLIHNPKAGQQDAGLLAELLRNLPDAEPVAIDDLGDVAERAKGRPWVALAGGDGTAESVAAALIGKNIPLALLPAGTYNNLARSLDIPLDPVEACALITKGTPRPTDVGFANGRPFFECLGSGLDAALYPLGEEIKSGRFLRWVDLLKRAHRYPRQRFTLTLDRPVCQALTAATTNESHRMVHALKNRQNPEITLNALMLTVSNGPYFGMNFHVAPGQRMDDGFLTVTVYSRYSKLQLWWHFLSISFGRREYHPKSIAFRVSQLHVTAPRPLPVHLDGTPQKGLWPLDITCHKGAIAIFRKS